MLYMKGTSGSVRAFLVLKQIRFSPEKSPSIFRNLTVVTGSQMARFCHSAIFKKRQAFKKVSCFLAVKYKSITTSYKVTNL